MLELIKLPYGYDEFEGVIGKDTMEIHHSRHLQAYVNNYNGLVEGTKFADMTIEEVITQIDTVDESIRQGVRNNGGGVLNHNIYFTQLANNVELKDGELKTLINDTFGSLEAMIELLQKAGATRFGSGWSWLVLNGGKLEVTSTLNQDNPLSEGKTPLLGIDVWEHAYYLDYQNKRPEYLSQIFSIINWDVVEERFNAAK